MDQLSLSIDTFKLKAEDFYNSLCPSARLYLVLMILFYAVSTLIFIIMGKNISLFKDLFYLIGVGLWTIIHDSLCNYGWSMVSWILVGMFTIGRVFMFIRVLPLLKGITGAKKSSRRKR